MKKNKNSVRKNMMPDPSALEGIPARDPHADFARKDAIFKKHRGAQR